MMRFPAILAALFLPLVAQAQSAPRAGDTYEIRRVSESKGQTSNGGTSSTYSRNMLEERVIAVRDGGVELEYDLPKSATANDRRISWQFPARVFRPAQGPLQLLNRTQLDARVDGWLTSGGLNRSACGQWIFTWNAFKIECDPQSALRIIEGYDLNVALRDGSPWSDPLALAPATLKKSEGPNGAVYTVELAVNPAAVRKQRAETDIIVAGFNQEKLTIDQALQRREKEQISGTISIRFETDRAGNVLRRVTVTRLETKGRRDGTETETLTETLERRPTGAAKDSGEEWT